MHAIPPTKNYIQNIKLLDCESTTLITFACLIFRVPLLC
uniref:Uncharacterized protein n=1 Tax=Arundo donax TaxID=35708 RepID=A0A0A9CUU8_ARUDO